MGKSIGTILPFQVILLAAFQVTFSYGGPLCSGCNHISQPRDCNRLTRCGDHESCYVEEIVTPSGTIWYNSGCMSVTKCQAYSRHGPIRRVQTSLDISLCVECCTDDYCNMAGCGTAGVHTGTNASLICFSCENHLDPNQCDIVTGCTDTESCYLGVEPSIILDQVFKSGCVSKLMCLSFFGTEIVGKRQNYGACHGCCDTDLCNRNCSVLKHQYVEHTSPLSDSEITTLITIHTQTAMTQTEKHTSSPTTQILTRTPSPTTQTRTQMSLPETKMITHSPSPTMHEPTTTRHTVSTRYTTLPASPKDSCLQAGYTFDEQLNLCIYMNHTRVTWEAARATCLVHGGDLLKNIDVPILNYLNNLHFYENDIFKERYWVGASDIRTENDWRWLDGSPILQKDLLFHTGEPNDYNHMEDCGTVYHLNDDKGLKMNDDPCNASFPFICQFHFHGAHGCNNTEYKYVESLDLCYKIHKENPTSWMEANLACQSEHAHLIYLKDISYEIYLQNLNFYEHDEAHRYWIGASDLREEGTFEWINGLPLGILQWHDHEPNSFEGDEDCISLMYFNWDNALMINDDLCSKHLYYICQEVARCRANYTYVKELDLCYKIHHENNYSWEQARTVCQSEGSDLIVVDNRLVMEFLYQILDNDVTNKADEKYWIGATDKAQEGNFKWVNGQQVENNFWHPTEPNNAYGNENCVALWWYSTERRLGMNDVQCETYPMKFVCQMNW